MERYAIVKVWNGNISMFNVSLFTTKKEAEKTRQWYIVKINAERIASAKFWGGKEEESFDDISLQVVKVII